MRGIIRELGSDGAGVTVVDLEAGLEELKRGTPKHTDTLLVVAEPYFRSIEAAARTAALGRDLGVPTVGIVANKVRDDEDGGLIRQVFEPQELMVVGAVPFDESVVRADRMGAALIDVDPDSPGVGAVESLADAVDVLGRTGSAGAV